MAKCKLFHNNRCSKSRQALKKLEAVGVKADVVMYLDEPPSRATIKQILEGLDTPPKTLLRTEDAQFKAAGLDPKVEYGKKDVLAILVKHPHLMQRPVLLKGKKAVIGRPVEKLDALL